MCIFSGPKGAPTAPKVFFQREVMQKAKKLITQHIRAHGKLTLNDCRELLQTTRKYMLPMLYYFDENGVTIRVGDDRVLRGGASAEA